MLSLYLLSAVVLVYCTTMASANPASDAWFMKEISDLMEAKEQMKELIATLETEGANEPTEEDEHPSVKADLNELLEAVSQQQRPDVCKSSCQSSFKITKAIYEEIEHAKMTINQEVNYRFNKIKELLITGTETNPGSSCQQIFQDHPNPTLGLYWISGAGDTKVQVYCEMGQVCGDETGGWMRLESLDGTTCPSPLVKVANRNRCTLPESTGSICSSVKFTVNGTGYSKVCGKIIGHQVGSTDAFKPNEIDDSNAFRNNIDEGYIDGISLTTYAAPRTHIWSFASALTLESGHTKGTCPCTREEKRTKTDKPFPSIIPPFVEEDYFCETGNTEGEYTTGRSYDNNALWDGSGCVETTSTCCKFNNPPWFVKDLGCSTCNDIEMRVCINQGTDDENLEVDTVELYVQ